MEFDKKNVLVRLLQPKLLLVLEGGVPPSRTTRALQITPEGRGDAVYPSLVDGAGEKLQGQGVGSPSSSSVGSGTVGVNGSGAGGGGGREGGGGGRVKVLALHRRKLDAMARAITGELARVGFEMPADPDDRLY